MDEILGPAYDLERKVHRQVLIRFKPSRQQQLLSQRRQDIAINRLVVIFEA